MHDLSTSYPISIAPNCQCRHVMLSCRVFRLLKVYSTERLESQRESWVFGRRKLDYVARVISWTVTEVNYMHSDLSNWMWMTRWLRKLSSKTQHVTRQTIWKHWKFIRLYRRIFNFEFPQPVLRLQKEAVYYRSSRLSLSRQSFDHLRIGSGTSHPLGWRAERDRSKFGRGINATPL